MSKSTMVEMSIPETAKFLSSANTNVIIEEYLSSKTAKNAIRSAYLTTLGVGGSTLTSILGIAGSTALDSAGPFVLSLLFSVSLGILGLGAAFGLLLEYSDVTKIAKGLSKVLIPISPSEWRQPVKSGRYHTLAADFIDYEKGIRISQNNIKSVHLAAFSLKNLFGKVAFAEEIRYDVQNDVYLRNVFYTSFRGVLVQSDTFTGPRYAIRRAVENI